MRAQVSLLASRAANQAPRDPEVAIAIRQLPWRVGSGSGLTQIMCSEAKAMNSTEKQIPPDPHRPLSQTPYSAFLTSQALSSLARWRGAGW